MRPAIAAVMADRLAFVALKTTGPNPLRDRITELGVVTVEGDRVATWSTLINPQRSIPEYIEQLTGIRNEQVIAAPAFAEVAEALGDRLHGRLLVAHHARFAYAFVRSEYRRLGQAFRADLLCTVRLSRRLFPERESHSLGSLIIRYGLGANDRERSLSDADLIWQFWRRLLRERGETVVNDAIRQQLRRPGLPPQLAPELLDEIPDSPGVYRFYGEGDALLYVGKSIHLRQRVRSHFASDLRAYKEMRLTQEVRRIDWQQTVGELGALLLESRLIKESQPIHNRRLRRASELCTWQLAQVAEGDFRPRLASGNDCDFGPAEALFGLFASRREAIDTLRAIATEQALCPIILGLEKPAQPGRPCFAHQVNKCRGACAGKEAIGLHSARLHAALLPLQLATWPYPGAIGLVERDERRNLEEVHVVHAWRYLGSARSDAGIEALLHQGTAARFDRDTYRLLVTHLGKGQLQLRLLHDEARISKRISLPRPL
ncbi:MAG: exonuclease domain-containing protein [Candidatus Accumulibacter sp. UW26]